MTIHWPAQPKSAPEEIAESLGRATWTLLADEYRLALRVEDLSDEWAQHVVACALAGPCRHCGHSVDVSGNPTDRVCGGCEQGLWLSLVVTCHGHPSTCAKAQSSPRLASVRSEAASCLKASARESASVGSKAGGMNPSSASAAAASR